MSGTTSAQAEAITGAQNWDAVRERFPERVDQMADGLMVGDPLADAVIADVMSDSDLTWRTVLTALESPTDATTDSEALRAFLDHVTDTPEWFDAAVARAGARAWWRFGSLQVGTLYQSLIYGYQAQGFVRPLIETGRLSEGTWDRVVATGRWVTLATAPGMMAPGAPGWVETVRIRLVHAMVRHHLLARGWDSDEWGAPINQTYSQLTITAGFLILPLTIAKDLGIRYSSAELEAITHLWRYIGWTMGVEPARLPVDFADATEIRTISREFRLRPVDASRVLVKALLDDGYRTAVGLPGPLDGVLHHLTKPLLRPFFSAISARWVDPEVVRAMGLRTTPLHHVVGLARPLVRSREVVRTLGLLGAERSVAQREFRLVTRGLGIDDDDFADFGDRYRHVDEGRMDTVA
ncbi:oxygenase MpaB family protein [Gordonia phthalatica]|uniref:ER-bound oxygenase mpaB/mpaB'/Rubber oxygenase catalytic domain-containing protein n=1 Tax=Gordonia phthalatica TaxID=1136941 RepID=A0A0N9NCS9_9ACTN|nr:oxygenase MpaB family protein [Gordonia phthalatica]ALG83273.1 hypothetical protein ACH46_00560 [Gordonia phthalatica]